MDTVYGTLREEWRMVVVRQQYGVAKIYLLVVPSLRGFVSTYEDSCKPSSRLTEH